MNNTVIKFGRNVFSFVASPLYQYDYGQTVTIEGIELPSTFECHFGNGTAGKATVSIGQDNVVTIPDAYLQTGKSIYGWIYLHTGENDGETEYTFRIPVIERPAPDTTQPTPVQQDVITQTIAALNAGVEQAEAAAAEIENMTVVAETLPTGSPATADWDNGTLTIGVPGGAKGDDGRDGRDGSDGHSPVVTASKNEGVTTVSVDGTPIATINDGEDGENGQNGTNGQDGYSPTATVTKSGNTATITITDKNGTTTASVLDGDDGILSATVTTIWTGTQVQYDAITTKDASTLYFIKET